MINPKTYSNDGMPPCTISWEKEPNRELMAKAYLYMYNKSKQDEESSESA